MLAVLRLCAFFPKNIFSSVETVAGVESRALGFRYMCMYNFFGSIFSSE